MREWLEIEIDTSLPAIRLVSVQVKHVDWKSFANNKPALYQRNTL
jgi:hypothetical protein